MNFSNNTVLITGGGSGIGLSFASHFIQHGSTVIICGRSEEKLAEAKKKYPELIACVCDVAKPEARASLFDRMSKEFPKLNILVNNAGIQKRYPQPLEAVAWEDVQAEIAINLEAPLHLSMLFIPLLAKQENPAIVNITSGLAFTPLALAPVYCATKAAFHSFTLSLRHRLADTSIAVVEVIPPIVNTDLGGQGLHTVGVDVAEFTGAIVQQLKEGQIEATYGTSAQVSRASRDQLDMISQRINARRG